MCRCLCVYEETESGENCMSFAWCDYNDELIHKDHDLWFKCIDGKYYRIRPDSIKSYVRAPDYILLNMGVCRNTNKLTILELAEMRDRVKKRQITRSVHRVGYARMKVHGVPDARAEQPKTVEFASKVFELLDSWPIDKAEL